MKLWELHNVALDGAIRTTPDGAAEIEGLVLSEKAYLLAVREFRPAQLVELVRRRGPAESAARLVAHFSAPEALQLSAGRGLAAARARSGDPGVYRSDEIAEGEPVGRRL
jgi:hypothetical protein